MKSQPLETLRRGGVIALLLAAAVARAEEDDGNTEQLDEIEVTATKTVKAQRDIPGSVGAIRGEDLEAMRAQGMKDYLKLIPGVTFSDSGNEESLPIIRGISTSLTSVGNTAATTGVYLNDIPFADLFITLSLPDLNPFDLERVELLKGPQGTLFGSGALAGAIRYIVHEPDHGVWGAKLSETVASAREGGVSPVTAGEVNVPLFGDAVALRGVGVFRKEHGVYDMSSHDANGNTLRDAQDADELKQKSGRLLASWNVTDDFKVSALYFKQTSRQPDVGYADQAYAPSDSIAPFASPRNHDFDGANLEATYDFGWGHLLSSTNRLGKNNYIDQHQEFGLGEGNQNSNEYISIIGAKTHGFTQEFRLSSPEGGTSGWEWLAGASYLDYKNAQWQDVYIGPRTKPDPTSPDQITDADKTASQVVTDNHQRGRERAVFGEVTRRLGEHFEATLGARQYETLLTADTELCGAQVFALFQETCRPDHFDDVSKGLNPKVSLRYLHNANVQLYVLAAKGFQFGGVQVNPPAPGFPQSAQAAGFHFGPFKSSSLWNYELGLRTEWLERRLRFDLTYFYLDWKDLQLSVSVPFQGTSVKFGLIANVGRAHSEGVESSLQVIPFAGATFTSSAALMQAVTDAPVDSGTGPIPPGTRLPGAPRFQWANVFSYEHALPYFTDWNIGPVITHTFLGQATDALQPTGTIGGYSTLDARLAVTNPGLRFQPELSLGMTNITDVRGVSLHLGGATVTPGRYDIYHFIPPRTAVASISMSF